MKWWDRHLEINGMINVFLKLIIINQISKNDTGIHVVF